jgi:hypothetical protein
LGLYANAVNVVAANYGRPPAQRNGHAAARSRVLAGKLFEQGGYSFRDACLPLIGLAGNKRLNACCSSKISYGLL